MQNIAEIYSAFPDTGILLFFFVSIIVLGMFAAVIKVIYFSMEKRAATAKNEAVKQEIIAMGKLRLEKLAEAEQRMKQPAHD